MQAKSCIQVKSKFTVVTWKDVVLPYVRDIKSQGEGGGCLLFENEAICFILNVSQKRHNDFFSESKTHVKEVIFITLALDKEPHCTVS